MNITISDKQMKPAVVHTNQFEDGVYQLTFTIADYMQGTVDLRKFKAYAVTSINGIMDITEVPYSVSGKEMTLTWDVSAWTLKEPGVIQYQIRFSESAEDGTAVWYSYKGILVNRLSINVDDHVSANYPTLLKQWIDRITQLSGVLETGASVLYMQPDASISLSERLPGFLYYQVENETTYEGHFEDHLGHRLGEFNAKHVADPDLNTMLTHGEYFCVGSLNSSLHSPLTCQVAFLHVTDSGSANQQLQTFYAVEDSKIRTFVRTVSSGTAGSWSELTTKEYVTAQLNNKAPIASPAFTGTPTAPTAASGTNSTQIATTAFVQAAVEDKQTKNVGTANMALVSDANGNITTHSTVSASELGALNGFIVGGGSVQAQINAANNHANWMCFMPNWSGMQTITSTLVNGYTASANCWILIDCYDVQAVSSDNHIPAPKTVIIGGNKSFQVRGTAMFPIPSGTTVKISDNVSVQGYLIPCTTGN